MKESFSCPRLLPNRAVSRDGFLWSMGDGGDEKCQGVGGGGRWVWLGGGFVGLWMWVVGGGGGGSGGWDEDRWYFEVGSSSDLGKVSAFCGFSLLSAVPSSLRLFDFGFFDFSITLL